MFLAASYNYFNGEEHIIASLRSVRAQIDHISVVSQKTSNFGQPIGTAARLALRKAVDDGLVDKIVEFDPDLKRKPGQNERRKRTFGLKVARKNAATHFLNLEADEFYRQQDFNNAKTQIVQNGWKSTSVNSFLHIRRLVWRALDITCSCFRMEILPEAEIGVKDFPCDHVDPTHKMTATPETHHHFRPQDIAMYHMNLVRRDIDDKLANSATTDLAFRAQVRDEWVNCVPGTPFHFPRKGTIYLTRVENEFRTFDPEETT